MISAAGEPGDGWMVDVRISGGLAEPDGDKSAEILEPGVALRLELSPDGLSWARDEPHDGVRGEGVVMTDCRLELGCWLGGRAWDPAPPR